jgi:hypothetical protein
MMIGTNNYYRATLYMLRRKPVLTAMMVSSLVLSITALVAAFTVWRAGSSCSIPRKTLHPYVVQVVGEMASGADVLLVHPAQRAAPAMQSNESG